MLHFDFASTGKNIENCVNADCAGFPWVAPGGHSCCLTGPDLGRGGFWPVDCAQAHRSFLTAGSGPHLKLTCACTEDPKLG